MAETIKPITIDAEPSAFRNYMQLMKMRLTLTVVFTALVAFAMASAGQIDWLKMLYLLIGGTLVVGSANGINQIIERNYDAMMLRTNNRPVASGRMAVNDAAIFCLLIGVAGVMMLSFIFNFTTGVLAIFSLISYAFVYTPLKRISSAAVLVGAFPGAVAPLLGWACVNGEIGLPALLLFVIQFAWQFPHFWAIAWVLDEDYQRAGFRLLPSNEGRGKKSALQILFYTILLVPVSVLPYFFGVSGVVSLIFGIISAVFMCYLALMLYRKKTVKTAKALMFGSFIYLPTVFISVWLDSLL